MKKRTDLIIEECSQETLVKHGIDTATITSNAVNAYWDDPGLNYVVPFDKNKAKYQHDSLFAELVRRFQGQYTQHSLKNIANLSKSKHRFTLCSRYSNIRFNFLY